MAAAEASTALCVMLEQLGDNPQPNVQDLTDFYDAVFEFGHLNETAVLEFSDAERAAIIQAFPLAVEKAAKLTPDLIQGKSSSSSSELDGLLTKIKLVTGDLFDLYKDAVEDKVPSNVEENIQKLATCQSEIEKKM